MYIFKKILYQSITLVINSFEEIDNSSKTQLSLHYQCFFKKNLFNCIFFQKKQQYFTVLTFSFHCCDHPYSLPLSLTHTHTQKYTCTTQSILCVCTLCNMTSSFFLHIRMAVE